MLIDLLSPNRDGQESSFNEKVSDFYLFGGCLEHLFRFGSQTHLTPMIVERQSALLFSVLQSPGT